MTLEVTDDAKDFLVTKGYDQTYGARPLRRAIQNLIEDPLAEGLLDGTLPARRSGDRRDANPRRWARRSTRSRSSQPVQARHERPTTDR